MEPSSSEGEDTGVEAGGEELGLTLCRKNQNQTAIQQQLVTKTIYIRIKTIEIVCTCKNERIHHYKTNDRPIT